MITKAKISYIKSLHTKKNRDSERKFIVEGEKLSEEILKSDMQTVEIFYTENLSKRIDINNLSGCEKEQISEEQMSRMSALKTPTTILMVIRKPDTPKIPSIDTSKLSLALDGVQDPGNLGTIIRLADWFGVETIFCSEECADVYNPKVIQATMGAITRVNIIYTELTILLENCSTPILGTFLDGKNIYTEQLPETGVIVMGNEGNGISKEIESIVTKKLLIPPYNENTVESLNVGVATAITLSEFRRRG